MVYTDCLMNYSRKLPNLSKEVGRQLQEVNKLYINMTKRRNSPQHSIVKMLKIQSKDKILKAAWEKHQFTYKDRNTRITTDFSSATQKSRTAWNETNMSSSESTMKEECYTPQSCLSKLTKKLKVFQDKHKLRQCVKTNPAQQKVPSGKR